MPVIVFICSCVLLSMLFRKVAETLEPDDYTTVQVTVTTNPVFGPAGARHHLFGRTNHSELRGFELK